MPIKGFIGRGPNGGGDAKYYTTTRPVAAIVPIDKGSRLSCTLGTAPHFY